MESPSELLSESNARDRFNNWVAIAVALFAAFMAITKVKDDNIVQAMMQAKSDAVDTWSEYQSKRIKHHLMEIGRDEMAALRLTAVAQSAAQLDDQMKRYESEIARYEHDESDLQNKARGLEAQ